MLKVYRQKSDLEAYREAIEQSFKDNPPSTRAEAACMIEKISGIRRSVTRIANFLKKGGLRKLAVGLTKPS